MKLIDSSKPTYKANFHTHTTESDGLWTPEQAMAAYRSLGYDILAITDHRRVTHPGPAPEGLLTIPGVELDMFVGHQAVHLLGLGVDDRVMEDFRREDGPQKAIDLLHDHGGQVILAHPAWSLNTPDFIASLKGLCAAEVWNSVSDIPYNAARADSSCLLDVAAALGQVLPFAANDDTHFYGSELGRGATMVQADALTVPAVLDALQQGRFYASQGPRFHDVTLEDGQLNIRCTAADTIIFYSDLVWIEGRTIQGKDMTEATYRLHQGEGFVRCQIIDRDGRSAWTSPVRCP